MHPIFRSFSQLSHLGATFSLKMFCEYCLFFPSPQAPSQVSCFYIAQYPKFASRGFTICAADDTSIWIRKKKKPSTGKKWRQPQEEQQRMDPSDRHAIDVNVYRMRRAQITVQQSAMFPE